MVGEMDSTQRLPLDDLGVGRGFTSDTHALTEPNFVAFARQFAKAASSGSARRSL